MSRRRWTHRRLGIGGDRPSELAMAGDDRLLDEVGARGLRGLAASPPDPLQLLLTGYAAAIDAQIPPVDRGVYRSGLPAVAVGRGAAGAVSAAWRRSRLALIPVAAGATVLAIVVAAMALPHATTPQASRPATVVQPHLAAVVESKSLLHHAGSLLTAAQVASRASDRAADVREARADLTHVAALVPLAPRAQRPALRHQVAALRKASQPSPRVSGRGVPARPGSAPGAGSGFGLGARCHGDRARVARCGGPVLPRAVRRAGAGDVAASSPVPMSHGCCLGDSHVT